MFWSRKKIKVVIEFNDPELAVRLISKINKLLEDEEKEKKAIYDKIECAIRQVKKIV